MLATYTLAQAGLTIVIFLVWVAFIGVAIWLLISLYRSKNFFAEDRTRQIVVVVLLGLFAVVAPLLGVPVLLVIWYLKRSRAGTLPDADEATREGPDELVEARH